MKGETKKEGFEMRIELHAQLRSKNKCLARIFMDFHGFLILVGLLIGWAGMAYADGIFIPAPGDTDAGFSVKYQRVSVEIHDQAAVTKIEQVFRNEANRTREAIYIFPLPKGAAISEFSMYVGGERVEGKLLDKDEARRIYEDIVRRRRDPALLEYADKGLFRARIFPIAPREEKKVTLKYTELLRSDNGTIQYLYPLNTEKFSVTPLENVSIYVNLRSAQPLKNIYSPSHDISVHRHGENSAEVSYEASGVKPDRDFLLYYSTSADDVGLTLLTQPEVDGGYFLFLASPRAEWMEKEITAKDVVFVFDRTGSMSGEKIQQARNALIFCLRALRPKDRFNVIAFNESADSFRKELVEVKGGTVDTAVDFVEQIDAVGGTNIDSALRESMRQFESSDRPKYLIFLTDGLPTVGETNIERILKDVKDENRSRVRLFSFGVGYDVNTHLLDRLALDNSGAVEYVKPGEDLEAKVSGFFRKVSFPVLSDVRIDFGGLDAYDVLPATVPDLFRGSQIVVAGRYHEDDSKVHITMSGIAGGKRREFGRTFNISGQAENDFISFIWASRRIGYLIEEIRLHGENRELIDEIIRLSKKFGIITEYTSFLVREPEAFSATSDYVHREFAQKAMPSLAAQTGAISVQGAGVAKKMKEEDKVSYEYIDANGRVVKANQIRRVEGKVFYQLGERWIETDVEPNTKALTIKTYSDAYFRLLEKVPSLGAIFAIGEDVMFRVGKKVVRISNKGKEHLTNEELKQIIRS